MEELDIWGRPAKKTPHNFEWALKTLRSGGKVRRRGWDAGCYIYVNQHGILVFFLGGELSPIRRVTEVAHNCDWQEISATDWERP